MWAWNCQVLAGGGSTRDCVEAARHEGIMLHSIWGCRLQKEYIWDNEVCVTQEVPVIQTSKHTAGLWVGWVGGIQAAA